MLAESVVTHALLVQRMAIAEEDAKHAGDLLVKAAQVIQEFGIGQNPETGETAIDFGGRWYTAAQWAEGFGPREVAMSKNPEGSVGPGEATTETTVEPEDDRPQFLKNLTLKVSYGDEFIPFSIHVGTDGIARAMPVAENAGGNSYRLDDQAPDGELVYPSLRGLTGGGDRGPFDLDGEELIVHLVRKARSTEMDRLRRIGIIDDTGELYQAPEFRESEHQEGEPTTRTMRPGDGHRYPKLGCEVAIVGRAEWYEKTGSIWSESDDKEIPVMFQDGKVESVLAAEVA